MKLPKCLRKPIICKKSWSSFKMWQCDWKHSNTHVMIGLCFFIWNVEHTNPLILRIIICLTCWWVHFPTLGHFTKSSIIWILSKLLKFLILNEFSFIAIYASISIYNSTFPSCSKLWSCYPNYFPFYGFHEGLIKIKVHSNLQQPTTWQQFNKCLTFLEPLSPMFNFLFPKV
jgi:hypothetical protein